MAYFNLTTRPRVFFNIGAEVFVKANWNDDWTWTPFFRVINAKEALPPTIGQASFSYDFGLWRRAELPTFLNYLPYFINGLYVKIVAFDRWGNATLWYGVTDLESVKPDARVDFPSGMQQFTAYSIEHLLDRRVMQGSYTDDGFIDRPLAFNELRTNGISEAGNKGNTANAFGASNTEWTNLDIVNYILARWVNGLGLTYQLTGASAALDDIVSTFDFEGVTPFDAFNQLIQRKRGLAWKVITDGAGTVYIHVISQLPAPLFSGDISIPANDQQADASFVGFRDIDVSLTFDRSVLFDRIVVKGGPIFSCFSLSYTDTNLEEGWTETEEDSYKAGTGTPADDAQKHDSERATDKFENVYQRHQVPSDWDWKAGDGEGGSQSNAAPFCGPGGYLDASTKAVTFDVDKTFERELPLEVEGTSTTEPEYRKIFVVYEVEDPDAAPATMFVYGDKLDTFGFNKVTVSAADSGLAIITQANINHAQALNHFDADFSATEDTNTNPEVDYTTMIATVFVKTDKHIKVDTANLGYPISEIGRTKVLFEPDAVAWYVVPDTVTEVTDGALVNHAGGFIRDDSQRIRTIAALAMTWYGLPRSIVQYEWGTISFQHPVGSMIRTVLGPEGITQVNTVVSRRSWSFDADEQSTTVETAFNELDFSSQGLGGGITGERVLNQEVKRLGKLTAKIPTRPKT